MENMANKRISNLMKDKQGFFKPGERSRIYKAAESLRDKVIIRLLWKTGRRVGEILDLRGCDIMFEQGLILWHIEKKREVKPSVLRKKKDSIKKQYHKSDFRKRQHIVLKPVDKKTLNLLAQYLKVEEIFPEDYIFTSKKDYSKHLTRQRVFQIVRKLCKKVGIEYVGTKRPHPHHFRHSFAIDIARKLKDPSELRKLQDYLEHDSIDTTANYLQFSGTEMRSLIEEVGEDEVPMPSNP